MHRLLFNLTSAPGAATRSGAGSPVFFPLQIKKLYEISARSCRATNPGTLHYVSQLTVEQDTC